MTVQILYSKAQAAEMLAMSVRSLDELRAAGTIVARKGKGGRVLFDHDELVSYAKSLPADGES